jgi:hypothetical protein
MQSQPLEIQPGAPVILDHSSNGGVWQGRPNVIPGFTILAINGGTARCTA